MKTNPPWVAALLGLLCLFCAGGAAHGQAGPNDVLIGEDADNYYYMDKSKYEGSAAQKYATQFFTAKLQVDADQNAIRELGFTLDAQRFSAYQEVAQEQRAEFVKQLEHTLFDAMLDKGLEETEAQLEKAKSLNPWNVNDAIKMLDSKSFAYPLVVQALRKIALQKDKPAMLAAYREFVDAAKQAKAGWETGADIAKDPDNADLRLLVGALKTMQGDPKLGLAVTAAEVGENLAYLGYLSGEVDDLAKTSDDKLSHLADLTDRLKGHVDVMVASKKAWQQATGYTTAEPSHG